MGNHNRQMNKVFIACPIYLGIFSNVWAIFGLFNQGGFYPNLMHLNST